MENSNRLPWIVAFSSLCFAVGVLLTVVLMRNQAPPQAVQAVAVERTPVRAADSRAAAPPPEEDSRGAGGTASVPPTASTPSPRPTSAPSPSPSVAAGTSAPQPGHRISGLVTDMKGSPVADATVQLILEQRGSQSKVELKADAQGRFESRNLAAPRVSGVVAEAPGYARSEPLPPFDLPMEGLEIALKRQAAAELRILDARANPAQPVSFEGEATVYLLRPDGAGASTATLGRTETAPAAGQFVAVASDQTVIKGGRYPLKSLEPGTYKAAVVTAGEPYAESEPFRVDASEGGEGTVVIGLRQTLVGFVKTDPEQEPVAGADVSLTATGRPAVVGIPKPYRTRTERDGRFTLAEVAPGNYRLTLAADGFSTKTLDPVPVSSGPRPEPATFYMIRSQPKLMVGVTGPENRPLRNAPLVLIADGAGARARTFFGRTDQAGTFDFGELAPGRYSLAVTDPNNRSRQKTRDIEMGEKDGERVERITFAPTVEVRGKVRRKGKAFEGLLSFLPRGEVAPETFAKADAEGNYEVDLEPGEYMAGEARQEGRVVLKVNPGDLQSADLDLP